MKSITLFVSHAETDKFLIKNFVDLLEGGIGVRPQNIFCSSLKGQGIKPGVDFKESIRNRLDGAGCVVAVLTPNFYASAFSMCELGGVWIRAKSFIPILVPPLSFGDLKAVLAGLQALKIDAQGDLDLLRDSISERLSISALPTPRWNERRDAFLKALPKILKNLPNTSSVPRATYENALKQLDEYKAEHKKAESEVERLKAINADLFKIKDKSKAANVIRKHSSVDQVFKSLVSAVKSSLRHLPSSVDEALYYRVRGEDYYPADDWDEVRRAIEDGKLELNGEENGVSPSTSDPEVKKAITALDELANWLEDPPPDFREWYSASFDDARADLTLRPFWQQHFH